MKRVSYLMFVLLTLTGIVGTSLVQADDGHAVVVTPVPQGQPVPVGPNESPTTVRVIKVNGNTVAVVAVVPMPVKPKFLIAMPLGIPGLFVYVPYVDRDHGDGIKTTNEVEVAQVRDPGGGVHDEYRVVTKTSDAAGNAASSKAYFPAGSVYIPDPPQPPGLMLLADRVPADPLTESLVLAALGLPDNPWTEVWFVLTRDLYFVADGTPVSGPIRIRDVFPLGDMNCDGAVNNQDIDPFVLALFNPAGYTAAYPECDFLDGDFTSDGLLNNQDIDAFVAALFGG